MKKAAPKPAPKKRAAPAKPAPIPLAPPPAPASALPVESWPIARPQPYPANARKLTDRAVDVVAESIRAFGWRQPIVVDAHDVIIVGHTRLLAARKLDLQFVPIHVAANLTPEQVKAYRLADNRTADESSWDLELLEAEMRELVAIGNASQVGFTQGEIDEILMRDPLQPEDAAPPLGGPPVAQTGDVWLCGRHRVLCGSCLEAADVAKVLNGQQPLLMITDPPYGIELDSEWRDRAGLNGCGPAQASYMKKGRTKGHSGDTRADWSEAFELVPSVQVAYVWHASLFTREVLNGLERIGFLYPQQIIWNKGRTVLTRTHYWYQHEPCWYVRKKNAPWYGKAGENATIWDTPCPKLAYGPPGEGSTIWDSPSPKFIMGGSDEVKFDHPTQKPVELMRKPILNHTKPGELIYEPFLGSGTTLAAAEVTARVCFGIEIDPKYVDVVVGRWQGLTGQEATLEADGRTFAAVKASRAAS